MRLYLHSSFITYEIRQTNYFKHIENKIIIFTMEQTKLLNRRTYINKFNFMAALICVPMFVFSQESKHFTLNGLVHSAYEKYPYAHQLDLTKLQKKESVKAIKSIWLPQLAVSGKTSYQSELSTIKLPENIEKTFGISLDEGKKFQYQGELGMSQLIYDGGMSGMQKNIAQINGDIQEYQIESSMLQIEDAIDNLFESILINKEQIKIIRFQQTDLELRKKDISFAIQNGISLKTVSQEIDADIIQLKQQETELQMQLCQRFIQLSSYTQENIDTTAVLELPQPFEVLDRNYSNRPDYKIYGKQLQNTFYQLKKINQEIMPQISLFANGYYGRPGLDAMDYSSHYSGIVGVSLKWNIASLYDNVHQKRLVNIDKGLVQYKKSLYEIEMNKQIDNLNIDLLKNKELIENDDNIVNIRSNVKDVAAIQLKNGTLTLTDYLIKLNDESQAFINKSIHRIEFLMDGAKMRTLLNKNN
jgi:outer membrane protein TolC